MNILFVDDQKKILEAAKKLTNWKKLQVDKVFTANSAVAAKKILSQQSIDIMLTDIEMPGEDGIALQRWQAKEYPSVACIFLTSHADFSYAQEAIRNGAFDYILQPASIPEIEEVVGRCIRMLKERELAESKISQYDAKLSETLVVHVFNMFYKKGLLFQMDEWLRDSHTEDAAWWYLPCLMEVWQADIEEVEKLLYHALEDAAIREDVFYVASRLDNREVGFLFYAKREQNMPVAKEMMEIIRQQLCRKLGCEMNIYLGQYAKEDLQIRIGQIIDFKSGRILKRNEVYLIDEPKHPALREPDGAVWGRWLIRSDTALVRKQLVNLLRFAEHEQYLTISYMQKLIHAFLEACSIACYELNRNLSELFTDSFSYEQMLHAHSSPKELCDGVDFCLRQYEAMLSEKGGVDSAYSISERIQEVLRYLDENMDRMISRREAAKYIFLNEDYFSRMFRKETGMGYKEYILKHKMDYAEKLLADTDMPIALVASKVGYDNYTNFTQMFKKFAGITPREHRSERQKTESNN